MKEKGEITCQGALKPERTQVDVLEKDRGKYVVLQQSNNKVTVNKSVI